MTKEILVVEDEIKLSGLMRDYLIESGFSVTCLEDGEKVIPHVKKRAPELILLDIMLPNMNGIEVCREIRKFSTVPIIMATAKVEEIDRLLGLELGADDYICKPYSPREVVARIKAVLRRSYREPDTSKLVVGPVVLDKETRKVTIGENNLELTPSEFGLLEVLMSHPEKVFSRNELVNRVQGYNFEGYDRTIDTHVKNLRKKIASQLPGKKVIKSIYGVGYQFTTG